MSQENERRAREIADSLLLDGAMLATAVDLIREGLDEAEASGAVKWRRIDYDDEATLPAPETEVLIAADWGEGNGRFVVRGQWDAKRMQWFDAETDGCGDQLEYPPGIVSHWAPWPLPPPPSEETKT